MRFSSGAAPISTARFRSAFRRRRSARRSKFPRCKGEEDLEIPEGTQSGQIFRQKGKGLPNPHGGKGDLYVNIRVVMPSKVSREQRRLLEQLGQIDEGRKQARRALVELLRQSERYLRVARAFMASRSVSRDTIRRCAAASSSNASIQLRHSSRRNRRASGPRAARRARPALRTERRPARWLAKIERVALSKRGESSIEFSLVEPLFAPQASLAVALHLLISLVKFDRFEWCLEKATELGVTRNRSARRCAHRQAAVAAAAKRQRAGRKFWSSRRSSRAACARRSSGARSPPEKAFALQSSADRKILLSERPDAPLRSRRRFAPPKARLLGRPSARLAIGPEGGWTDAEIAAARAAGFVEASLGENILRTETAVIASLAVVRFVSDM